MKNGKGQLYAIENNVGSAKSGYWKNDKYIGLYENPYKIISATSQIGRMEVNNMDKKGSSITVTVTNTARVNIVMTDFQITKVLLKENQTPVFQAPILPYLKT